MVECFYELDPIFDGLGDKTRRDILRMVSDCEMSVGQIAKRFSMSFAGISKHIMVLEKANLVIKRRNGKEQLVSANTQAIEFATDHLKRYEQIWNQRFDKLENVINERDNK